jgi:hypothetical protein
MAQVATLNGVTTEDLGMMTDAAIMIDAAKGK